MAGGREERTERKKGGREGGREGRKEERNLSMYHIYFPVKDPGRLPLHQSNHFGPISHIRN